MQLKDLLGKYGTKFTFVEDAPPGIPYMMLNSRSCGLSFMAFVQLSNGNVCQFGEEDSILNEDVILVE